MLCCVGEDALCFAMVTNSPQISVVEDKFICLIQSSLCKTCQGSCPPRVGSAFQGTRKSWHLYAHTSIISQAEWEPNDLILTIKFSIPQATQACSVHNPLERTNHKTPPTPQLQVGLGNLILSYNEKGRKLNKDKYLQSTFNMNCSKFAKQLYAVRMNVLILNTRGTID